MASRSSLLLSLAIGLALILAGCRTAPTQVERQARAALDEAPRSDYLGFALSHHPSVAAAHAAWRASVEEIAPSRALPDPKLSLQADLSNMVMSLMPGVMFDIMLPGKRAAMEREAAAGSEVARQAYRVAVLEVTAALRKSWVELAFVREAITLNRELVASLEQSQALAGAEYSTGAGMGGSLDAQIRLADELAKARSQGRVLDARLAAARSGFKAALGQLPGSPDPAWPEQRLRATEIPPEDQLWAAIDRSSPELARMRAMVEMAVAGEEMARRAGSPGIEAGLMVDLKQAPLMWRPSASVSLPVWRSRIEGLVSAAQARREAAMAGVDAERLSMAAELARMLFMLREADQMISFIDETALPNLARSRASAEASLQAGMPGAAAMVAGSSTMALTMQLERLNALRERELATTELLRMSGASLLP